MKYIRTVTGVYCLLGDYFTKQEGDVVYILNEGINKILKQADTIEELCDGYVIEHPINAFKFFYDKEDMQKHLFNTCMRMFRFYELKIYGVIRTDKGLIYVAKMNEKGELELL